MSASLEGTASSSPSKGLGVALWIAQVLLAAVFGMSGAMKLFTPIAELAQKMPWVAHAPWLVRFIGVSELAGALGLVLPSVTRVRPGLTPLAALGLVVVMALAVPFHLLRGEVAVVPVPVVLGALAGFVAWGRHRRLPIAPR